MDISHGVLHDEISPTVCRHLYRCGRIVFKGFKTHCFDKMYLNLIVSIPLCIYDNFI